MIIINTIFGARNRTMKNYLDKDIMKTQNNDYKIYYVFYLILLF